MRSYRNTQAGGTLLGIIIGLLIGLAIALAVAIMINKSPMPFMNKTGWKDKAPDAKSDQAGDPNRPMFGKQEAARLAAQNFVKEPATAAEIALAAPNPKASDNTEIKITTVKSSDTVPTGAEIPQDKWLYYLQAGAFRAQADAESVRARLALQGFEASVSERASDSGPLYRVRLGPYHQLDSLNRVRSKLADTGMDVAVVRLAK